jgi:hypothetical protein
MHNIAALIGLLSSGKGAKFCSLTYRAKGTGELARHLLILGASTDVLYGKDMEKLTGEIIPKLQTGLLLDAAFKVLASRKKSLEVGIGHNPKYVHAPENGDTYVMLEGVPGCKVHKETGEVHLTGLSQHKTVLEAGEYKEVKSKPETLAKQEIEKQLPSARFRQFLLNRVLTAKLNGDVWEVEAE